MTAKTLPPMRSAARNGKPTAIPAALEVASSPQVKITQLTDELCSAFIGRDELAKLTMTAVVAQKSMLVVSPPGAAKSMLLETLIRQIKGATKFVWLMGKFTEPDEIFGPIDLASLERGERKRNTARKLPEAHFAFLDEYWKASTAIGNALLRIINERKFDDGSGEVDVPLRCLFMASNEFAPDGETAALFDRAVLRFTVDYLPSPKDRNKLLWSLNSLPQPTTTLTLAECDQAHAEANALPITEEAKEAAAKIVEELITVEKIRPSDRRLGLVAPLIRAAAYVAGAKQVEPEHLEILSHMLWTDPEGQPRKVAAVVARIANPVGLRVNELLQQIEDVLAKAPPGNRSEADRSNLANAMAKVEQHANEMKRMKSSKLVEKAVQHAREVYSILSRRNLNAPNKGD